MIGVLRLRKRLRSLAQPRPASPFGRLTSLVAGADVAVDPSVLARRGVFWLAGAVGGGFLLFGLRGAVAAPAALVAAAGIWVRRRKASRLARLEQAFPAAVRAVADAVRAGMNVPQAVEVAYEESEPPLARELARLLEDLSVGVSMEQSLESFSARCPVPGADLFAIALVSANRSGADLPPVLDGIVEAARERRRLGREMRAATAQGRLTAVVVGGLPAAFLLVMGAGARAEIHFLFGEPLGWGLLGVGAALEAAGFAWINKMVKR